MFILSELAVAKPKIFMRLAIILSLLFIAGVAAPTFFPKQVPFLAPLSIDTDPENMLSADEPVRIFHNDRKKEYSLYDMIVVGVVNKSNPQGVFNPQSLQNIYDLGEYARQISWQGDNGPEGVIQAEIISPSNVDNIAQAGEGTVRFEWLMSSPPATEEAALDVYRKASHLPFLDNTLVSGDGKAMALYIPITAKNISYQVAAQLKEKIATFSGDDTYHITGLPIAQDTFGVEMFIQMAVSAPLAMLLIFALMWVFFRSVKLIIAPMIVAMVSVIFTMGALVMTGHTVHIMSSMIPVFIMPIAVLDAVHILSDFFDVYPRYKDRRKTIRHVMEELSKPMLFTSLTTAAGFGSLAFTPIPPVQVFGIFIALGVAAAWFFTVTLVPAYIMLMSEKSLDGFGMAHHEDAAHPTTPLARILYATGRFTYARAKLVLLLMLVLIGVSGYGISKIQINDNPVKWFSASHPIRIADKELNQRFAGTYMAYLELAPKDDQTAAFAASLTQAISGHNTPQARVFMQELPVFKGDVNAMKDFISAQQETAADDEAYYAWDDLAALVDEVYGHFEWFKHPDMLHYVEKLQEYLLQTGLVGKSNALPDVVKTVHRELFLGKDDAFRIPETQNAVAQTLLTYQNSHRPNDLWHFTTPSYDKTVLWIQLKSGDNKDMSKLVEAVDTFFSKNPAPVALDHQWFGLTYINVVWQQKMVSGMMEAFLGSFVIVLVMMIFLFRSITWGILSMVPLTVTIAFIYGIIGLIGKDYDMPVAVLSSLSLGLAVDYAIHFLARSREAAERHGSWKDAIQSVFGEPARAITRNVIVIGMGFTPLLFAPLVPYKTVGFFISAILLFAGIATLLILPALITLFEKFLFKSKRRPA
ncbi:MAG: MMPL family transporter [Rhodospirillales bacterium]|nr:MMPL family transporter [Rhodospirillales bacterium]MCB9965273.1 MMPL family transporter [Rhodospirillales bacterium]MCB9972957.1 MMPL family transporter [Rhodospirillales bacterium]